MPTCLSLSLPHLAAHRPSSPCPLTYPPACQPHSPLTFPPIHLQLAGQAQPYELPLSSLPMKGDMVQEVLLIHPRLLLPWHAWVWDPTHHPPHPTLPDSGTPPCSALCPSQLLPWLMLLASPGDLSLGTVLARQQERPVVPRWVLPAMGALTLGPGLGVEPPHSSGPSSQA